MAERRMFAKTIVLSDAFLDLPMSARCLYFTLGMLADDDGFVNAPRSIMRQCGASDDDMRVLIAKKFALVFDSGVIVIKHWRINNYLRQDRHVDTKYTEELSTLSLDENGAYTRSGIPPDNQLPTTCQPRSNQRYTQDSIGKDSLEKGSVDQSSKGKGECEGENPMDGFSQPKKDRIDSYAKKILLYKERGWDPELFYRQAEKDGIRRVDLP